MTAGSSVEVAAAAMSLIIGGGGLAYGAHRMLSRIEGAVKSAERNTRELTPNGGSSIKDELTVGRGGMVDRQMRMEDRVERTSDRVETLVDALGTVRARLERTEAALRREAAQQNEKIAGQLEGITSDVSAVRDVLQTHVLVAESQVVAISAALLHLGVDPDTIPLPKKPL